VANLPLLGTDCPVSSQSYAGGNNVTDPYFRNAGCFARHSAINYFIKRPLIHINIPSIIESVR